MKRKLSKLFSIGLTIALLTSLMIAAVPAGAMSAPVVSFPTTADATISTANADYIIRFVVGKQLSGNATVMDTITITFPTGTTISAPTATISAGPGWIQKAAEAAPTWQDATATLGVGGNWTFNATYRTISYTMNPGVAEYIGEGAEVRIAVTAGIKNPATPGDYTLTVGTSNKLGVTKEAAVTSSSYNIATPGIVPLPGVVLGKNSAGILMAQSTSINTCIVAAGVGGTVEVGPGTYDEAVVANQAGQTIIATGDPGTVIIKNVDLAAGGDGTVTITAGVIPATTKGVTLKGFTIEPNAFVPAANMVTIAAHVTYATIEDCVITSGGTSAITVTGNATTTNTIKKTTLTATGTTAKTAIIAASQVYVTDCTITVGALGTAITSAGGAAAFPYATTISGTSITGSSGNGVVVNAGLATITKSTLKSLTNAIDINGGSVSVKGCTIDGCGSATAGLGNAITIDGGTAKIYNNTIQNSPAANYAVKIGAAPTVYIHFNNILNNTLAVSNSGNTTATHNWWGSASGPASTSITGLTGKTAPVLGGANSNADMTVGLTTLTTKDTVGIDVAVIKVDGTAGNAALLSVSKYSANPEITTPPILGTGKVLGYYDLYASGIGAGQTVQVKFYGAVTQYSKLYYAGGISGKWSEITTTVAGVVPSGINVAGGYAYCNLNANTSPSINDLGGTVFALVDDKTITSPSIAAVAGGSPVVGAYDVSVSPMFTWSAVAQAIRYEITLSEFPDFSIIAWSHNVPNNFYKVTDDEMLNNETTYYWRVRGVLAEPFQEGGVWKTPSTPWTVGIFTTEAEVVVVEEQQPIIVDTAKPEITVELPAPIVNIEPSGQAIPNYMLWIIVVVGAVLVIALIVLIVRTRRVV